MALTKGRYRCQTMSTIKLRLSRTRYYRVRRLSVRARTACRRSSLDEQCRTPMFSLPTVTIVMCAEMQYRPSARVVLGLQCISLGYSLLSRFDSPAVDRASDRQHSELGLLTVLTPAGTRAGQTCRVDYRGQGRSRHEDGCVRDFMIRGTSIGCGAGFTDSLLCHAFDYDN